MSQVDVHVALDGTNYVLAILDKDEQRLVDDLKQFAKSNPNWAEFSNLQISKVGDFYKSRGLSRKEITKTPVWLIAQDIAERLHVAEGRARPSDYRDELEFFIATRFPTRRAFCEATGLSEDMLSHVLAKRKDFGIQTLSDALAKVGYAIHITPLSDFSSPSST
jgi:hypothetical protein